LRQREKWEVRASSRATSGKRQTHDKQKKGFFVEQQKELVRRILAKRARGLPVSGIWCRITMRNLVKSSGDSASAKTFKASERWFQKFRKRWGFSFQEKTNVKKKSVQQRLPYVRQFHQYLLYKAFKEKPS